MLDTTNFCMSKVKICLTSDIQKKINKISISILHMVDEFFT